MAKVQVMVLDDEDRVRDMLVDVLAAAGYTVAGLASGAEGLARFAELDPDLIVLDMMMPGIDGFEFLARLRASPGHKHVPVLISSALGKTLGRAIETRSAETLGIIGVLDKPLRIETLLELVKETIGPGRGATPEP